MICFPLDNTEYEANALGAWCGTRTRGVFSNDTHYTTTANGDMSVTVSGGLAWLKAGDYWGVCVFEDNAQSLTHDIADGSLVRLDAICVRLDKNLNRAEIVIKKGAIGASPVLPAIQRNLNYDEIYVASVLIRAGAASIQTSDITDLRLDENYCGLMRDGVTGIPTALLQAQAEALLELIRDELSGINDGTEFMLRTDYDLGNIVKNAGGIAPYLDSALANKANTAQNVFIGSAATGQTIQIENVRQYDHLRVWITNGTVDGVPIEVCRKTTPAGVLNDAWESGTISPSSDAQTGATVTLNTAADGNGLVVTGCSRMNHNAGGTHGSVSSAYVIVRVDAYK